MTKSMMKGCENVLRAGVLTVSDRSAKGDRPDTSGPQLVNFLKDHGVEVVWTAVVPDEEIEISRTLVSWADTYGADLILTTGGTGVSPRDVTPEATMAVVTRTVPGIAEAMRRASFHKTAHAMLSRAIAGVRRNSLIINLPGSPKGAVENLEAVMPAVAHAIAKIQGDTSDCA